MNTADHHPLPLDPSAPWIGAGALQVSLCPSPSSSSSFTFPYPSPSALLLRRRNPLAPKPRRKSRAAAKRSSPTTYISADAASFRKMVEWVTGLGSEQPAEEAPTVRPAASQQIDLPPTLDTSAPFLAPVAAAGSLPASDFVPVFPTLESWGVM